MRTVAGSGRLVQVLDAWFHSTSRTGGICTEARGTLAMNHSACSRAGRQK
jgi:hypothetical protein